MITHKDILTEKYALQEKMTKMIREFKDKLPENYHLTDVKVLQSAHSGPTIVLTIVLE